MSKDLRTIAILIAVALATIWAYFLAVHHLHQVIAAEGATGEFDCTLRWFDLPMGLTAAVVVIGCILACTAIGERMSRE